MLGEGKTNLYLHKGIRNLHLFNIGLKDYYGCMVPKVVMPMGDTGDKCPVSGKCSLWHA